MWKKILLMFSFLLCISQFNITTNAKESIVTESYQEGNYTIITTTTIIPEKNPYTRASKSRTVTRSKKIRDTSGKTLASFSITAKFSFDGKKATCTNVSHSTAISDNNWFFTQASSTKSGSSATGYFTIKSKTQLSLSGNIQINCDKNGNIS